MELLDTITQIQIKKLWNFKTMGGGLKKNMKLSNILLKNKQVFACVRAHACVCVRARLHILLEFG